LAEKALCTLPSRGTQPAFLLLSIGSHESQPERSICTSPRCLALCSRISSTVWKSSPLLNRIHHPATRRVVIHLSVGLVLVTYFFQRSYIGTGVGRDGGLVWGRNSPNLGSTTSGFCVIQRRRLVVFLFVRLRFHTMRLRELQPPHQLLPRDASPCWLVSLNTSPFLWRRARQSLSSAVNMLFSLLLSPYTE
jgi:hypothetical protein